MPSFVLLLFLKVNSCDFISFCAITYGSLQNKQKGTKLPQIYFIIINPFFRHISKVQHSSIILSNLIWLFNKLKSNR